jgi:hypothetical protein
MFSPPRLPFKSNFIAKAIRNPFGYQRRPFQDTADVTMWHQARPGSYLKNIAKCVNVGSRASWKLLEQDVTTQHQGPLGSYLKRMSQRLKRMLQRSIKSVLEAT